ncbi:TonB-dependent receptor domain-containing protein [Endozoicomonas arenosclerae]|uniref:TonB-dependent receptor domain-containing protein n=1 Tax=Endozoicomonas arenosclerae TaxID=1633495 RepID=UPI000782D146|nr:TonB-dependent receptor [Endozoicomonas arenosclerae]
MSRTLRVAVALATAGLAGTLQASEEVTKLDKVVVTASRTAQSVDEALAAVTVITREDIERSQATSVTELLSKTPGMQVAASGGAGSLPGIYLRGTKTAQTLVLLDGMKINSASSGVPPLQYLDPEDIERIEIVRGPRSSLYGADAVGGVIQIFSRRGEGKPHLKVKVGGGSRNTGEYGLTLNGRSDGLRYNLGANVYETGGYNFTIPKENGDDNDAYRNKSVFGSLSNRFSDDLEIGLAFSHSEGKSEYDNSPSFPSDATQPFNLFRITNVSTFADLAVNDIWSSRLEVGYAEELTQGKSENQSTGETTDSYWSETKRYSSSWKNDIAWHESQLLTAGIDYSNETYDGNREYNEDSRYNAGVFVQNSSSFDGKDLQLSLRKDKNEAYGYKTTGSASFGMDLTDNLRFITSYGTAFRAPTLGDLYYPGSSNPNLKPETSENIEAGLKGSVDIVDWSATIYQNTMDDMIAYDSKVSMPVNIEDARIRGVEFTLQTQAIGWDINSSLSLLDPENRSGVNKGKVLIYRAKQLFTTDFDKKFGKIGLGATFRAQGKSYADASNDTEVSGFGTVDLRLSYQFTPELKTGLKVVNLLEKDYQSVNGYRGEPLGAFVTVTWTPEL